MDPTAKGSMFQNPIFQMAINLHWFGRRERARSSYFSAEKKVPLQIIALVASAVGALGAARIPPVTCRFRGPFRSSPVVLSLPLHYHIHLPSEPRDTVPYGDESVIRRHPFGLSFSCQLSPLSFFFSLSNPLSLHSTLST